MENNFISKKVERRGNKWCVIHCHGPDTGKPIKCFATKEEAEKMHRAIQANKTIKARGEGQGQGNAKQGDGGATYCVCPKCGYKEKHERNTPCNKIKCPKCGTLMQGSEKMVTNSIEKSEKPPKAWFDKCVSAVSKVKGVTDAEALCGWVYYHHASIKPKESDIPVKKEPTKEKKLDIMEQIRILKGLK